MHLFHAMLFLLAAMRWGDWKNWRSYYPTILFFIGGDLLKNTLFHDHRMWEYQETIFGEKILFGHLVINFLVMAVIYPSTIMIYLGEFPVDKGKRIFWILFWVLIYSAMECINLHYKVIKHYYGWNIWWSVIFDFVMFVILRIHHTKPLLAWAFSITWLIILWNIFDLSHNLLK
ncbi:CBO0543 family protein [Bacillus sp. USDA818B3_A]|uniref:CBO0543 family protein n=1 Tax=Bacillus sp. USDA818B3_A TaxID=2698834 RepID=UPI00136C2535|nr:CBO0543 family protein [Bacillus sp. USDA818B3_A]